MSLPGSDDRLSAQPDHIAGKLSAARLAELVGISLEQVRAWVRAGLLQPVANGDSEHFDFQQVVMPRRLGELTGSDVPPAQVRRNLRQIRDWLDKTGEPLATSQETAGQFLLRRDDGLLADTVGQLYFDFAEGTTVTAGQLRPGPTAEQWFEQACATKKPAGSRRAPTPIARRSWRAVRTPRRRTTWATFSWRWATARPRRSSVRRWKPSRATRQPGTTWARPGRVRRRPRRPRHAYEAALKACPGFPDTHYNLADFLDQRGQPEEAPALGGLSAPGRDWNLGAVCPAKTTGVWRVADRQPGRRVCPLQLEATDPSLIRGRSSS